MRLIALFMLAGVGLFAQTGKQLPPSHSNTAPAPDRLTLRPEALPSIPPAGQTFGAPTPRYTPKRALSPLQGGPEDGIKIERDTDGTPVFFEGVTELSTPGGETSHEQAALAYWNSLRPEGLAAPLAEFKAGEVQTDAAGHRHIRLAQYWNQIPVYGGEIIVHQKNGQFKMANGRYFPTPALTNAQATLSAAEAITTVKNDIGPERIKTEWTENDWLAIGTQEPFKTQLVVYHLDKRPYLAWHIVAHPNLMQRFSYFIDAQTGAILHHYDHTCRLFGHTHPHPHVETAMDGPVTANGADLLGVNRTFGAWQAGNTYYLEDASQPMFNSGASQMPANPVGAIITLDAKNTSPANQSSFDFDFVKSGSLNFNNPTGVSAHWNSIKSYQYFKNKFNRNSIDGTGGNIISFVNVADDNGSSMENAFWNGAAMWYGNGGSTFRRLARGLDVGGHEMTHGVIEKTANLEYQGESGALNESFADIFGAMIDLGDWQIGEDVMQPGTHTCLRDLSNPNNGVAQGSPFWQPSHTGQQYNGPADNGGVHINSGIVNRAYYLFATSAGVGTDKAEQVYYKALKDYLVKSSKFVDCRIAVIQAATDLYGASVATAAANAFTTVGIVGSAPSGNYLGQLSPNPGTAWLACVPDDLSRFDIANAAGAVLGSVYNSEGLKSRPSISDNGSLAVFVNETGHIILMDFTYPGGVLNYQSTQLSSFPEWRNAAISKDGRFLAATTDFKDNKIYIFDLLSANLTSEVFSLYNPTYTQGQSTGNVQFSDVMEFDYSGQFLMYDAYNKLTNSLGQTIDYWDIGFLQFWNNGNFANGDNPYIEKLFSGLPPNTDIGNPTFAKNSPYVIAFDYYDGENDRNDILGANVETGDYDLIISDIGDFGWPNYNKDDNSILFHAPALLFGYDIYRQGVNSSKIQPQGGYSLLVSDHVYGVWFANGNRGLSVDVSEGGEQSHWNLQASPNPVSEQLRLQFDLEQSADLGISISDMFGMALQTYTTAAPAGKNTVEVDMSHLPAGMYVVRLQTAMGQKAVKVIKR